MTTTDQMIPLPIVRALVEIYYDFQHQRIITGNRIQMNSERNGITDAQLEYFGINKLMKDAEVFEKAVQSLLKPEITKHPLWQDYLSGIQGIGIILASGLIAYIGEIKNFERISDLWQYAGVGMNTYCPKCKEPTHVQIEIQKADKKKVKANRLKPMKYCNICNTATVPIRQRRMTGYMSNWNDKFKVLCWKFGQSFLKQQEAKSGYRQLYNSFKKEEREKHPEKQKLDGKTMFNDGHIHNRALRKTVKIFLSHVWLEWRRIEGLAITEPYAMKDGKHNIIKPFRDKD